MAGSAGQRVAGADRGFTHGSGASAFERRNCPAANGRSAPDRGGNSLAERAVSPGRGFVSSGRITRVAAGAKGLPFRAAHSVGGNTGARVLVVPSGPNLDP